MLTVLFTFLFIEFFSKIFYGTHLQVLATYLFLSIVCLSVGFYSCFRFGLYDQCDPERTFSGWSVHRDQFDLSGGLIILGFIFLGVFIGVIGYG